MSKIDRAFLHVRIGSMWDMHTLITFSILQASACLADILYFQWPDDLVQISQIFLLKPSFLAPFRVGSFNLKVLNSMESFFDQTSVDNKSGEFDNKSGHQILMIKLIGETECG